MKALLARDSKIIQFDFSEYVFDGYKADSIALVLNSREDCEEAQKRIEEIKMFFRIHKPCFDKEVNVTKSLESALIQIEQHK